MHRFDELKIWQKAMDVTENCYSASENFPTEEKVRPIINEVFQVTKMNHSLQKSLKQS